MEELYPNIITLLGIGNVHFGFNIVSVGVTTDTFKTKKDTSAHAVAHLVVEVQAMIYNAARVRRLSTKFQVDTCKS